jgi:hypothetical protein
VIELLKPAAPRRRMRKSETAFLIRCYGALLAARLLAEKKQQEPDQSPVLLSVFGDIDESTDLIRWMVYQGHVEHMRPLAALGAGKKAWQRIDSLRFNNNSALAITPKGVAYAEEFMSLGLSADPQVRKAARQGLWIGRLAPHYDQEAREFRWGCHLLKHFAQPSENQVLLLTAAEEQHWSDWFDNPFTGGEGIKPKERLHGTIRDLNRNQKRYFIHFKGDGTGKVAGWEFR